MRFQLFSLALVSSLLLSACNSLANLPATTPTATLSTQPVSIQFKAEVNGQPFACDQTYTAMGSSKTQISALDFRFYVSQVQLVNAQGQAVPVQLEQDGKWQYKNLALLDFENKTGSCDGTADTHFEVKGTVPTGNYKGLKFEMGVPFELNHQDVNQAASPLNLTSLFWVWRSGYKFARLDVRSTGQPQGWFLHLGSTGCTGMAPMSMAASGDMHIHHEVATADPVAHGDTSDLSTMAPESCAQPNRVSVSLPDFELQKNTVVADLGHLLADSDLDQNQANSAGGCMSASDDSDCANVFKNWGLPFGAQAAGTQKFFALK
jgi:uncharacterized repeat protein (TIGR04052 family)